MRDKQFIAATNRVRLLVLPNVQQGGSQQACWHGGRPNLDPGWQRWLLSGWVVGWQCVQPKGLEFSGHSSGSHQRKPSPHQGPLGVDSTSVAIRARFLAGMVPQTFGTFCGGMVVCFWPSLTGWAATVILGLSRTQTFRVSRRVVGPALGASSPNTKRYSVFPMLLLCTTNIYVIDVCDSDKYSPHLLAG